MAIVGEEIMLSFLFDVHTLSIDKLILLDRTASLQGGQCYGVWEEVCFLKTAHEERPCKKQDRESLGFISVLYRVSSREDIRISMWIPIYFNV
jgi:hypothetical protein